MNNEHLETTRKNLTDFQDMWDKACEEGVFKPEPTEYRQQEDPLVYDPMSCSMAGLDPVLLQEVAPDGTHSHPLAEERIPNPVYPDSVGRDDKAPKSVWVNEEMLKELEELKNKLFELENKFAKTSGDFVSQNSVDKKTMSQIESIKKQIDQVSNTLGIKDEPSPWVVNEK